MLVINTMNILNINSFSNEKVKYVIKLKEKRFRDRERKFVIEGYRELAKANLSGKIKFDTLYISPECFLGVNEDDLIRNNNDVKKCVGSIPEISMIFRIIHVYQ